MSPPDDSAPPAPAAEEPAEAEPPERLVAIIAREGGDWSAFEPAEVAIHRAAAALARHRGLALQRRREASIVLGSDELVRRLNRTYRGKDAATNVLSFPYQPPPGADPGDGYLGDVILAAETVQREAAERCIAPAHHLQHLVVHGLLHLLGYDHATDAEAAAMEGLEAEVLAGIGVPNPYAASAAT
jgi:probable rRNA maturation factor